MSPKSYIMALSLAASATVGGYLIFADGDEAPGPASETKSHARSLRSVKPADAAPLEAGAADAAPETAATPARSRASRVPYPGAKVRSGGPLPLETRAAKVEQQANRELDRLITLLNLSEDQQDKVFQTLAKHSRHWSPEMQFAGSGAGIAGKRSSATPGLVIPGTGAPPITEPVEKSPAADTTPSTEPVEAADPLEEIMALLDPEQQSALVKDEMDRSAWWAEILPQILPPDDIPGLDGTKPSPGAGETREYEGSDTLE
jgi:hypothetical protein